MTLGFQLNNNNHDNPCAGDHLEIYGNTFAEATGCFPAVSYNKNLVSDGNNLTLRFVSDTSGHTTGFQLSFTETWEGEFQPQSCWGLLS